ncbi:MAG TPA: EVE domain-containing protein [Planctomycetota bacterium]
MNWLFKTEPSDYSFDDLVREGRTRWEGVRNPTALKNLRGVRKGDSVMIYHTGGVRAVVGLARAASDAQGDAVDLVPDRLLARPVTLGEVRKNSKLRTLDLVRITRLSVMPVPEPLWTELMRMSAT